MVFDRAVGEIALICVWFWRIRHARMLIVLSADAQAINIRFYDYVLE